MLTLLEDGRKGEYSVIVRVADTNLLLKLPDKYSTDAGSLTISSLKNLLGNENVVLRG